MSIEKFRDFQQRYVEERISVDGDTWSYRQTGGSGPTLLMLPGAQGTGDMFYQTALALGERLNVITVTYPGSAEMERLANAFAGLMDALGLQKANILGSSLGGYLVQLFALHHADRIETLFIANTFCDASAFNAGMPKPDDFAKAPPDAVMKGLLDKIVAAPEPEPAHRYLKDVAQALMGPVQKPETLKARVMAILLSKPVPPLPLPQDRIVMIDDDEDPVILPEMRRLMRERYAAAEHHMIAGGGHYPGILRADEYAQIIEQRLLGTTAS